MNVNVPHLEQETPAEQGLSVVDCDIHPAMKSVDEMFPFLAQRWRAFDPPLSSARCALGSSEPPSTSMRSISTTASLLTDAMSSPNIS